MIVYLLILHRAIIEEVENHLMTDMYCMQISHQDLVLGFHLSFLIQIGLKLKIITHQWVSMQN